MCRKVNVVAAFVPLDAQDMHTTQAPGEDNMIATPTTIANPVNTDIDALKTRLKATWMDGNYDYFSRFMTASAVEFLDRLGVDPGTSLLDVACGSGQLALIAASRGANVSGVDIATNAILAARGRAASEGYDIRFDEGDAEALPYKAASFDVVASLFGAMFAPRPELVAAELLRVCRPGGRIAMGNWTREGFIGQMFKAFARFIAPPGMPSPVLWGDESTVRERFGAHVSGLRLTRVIYQFDYPFSPADVVEFFRQNYGPTTRAFTTLGAADQAALRKELVELWSSHNKAGGPARTIVDSEYLEVVAVTRTANELKDIPNDRLRDLSR
jgi:SAM-dependent methyltransferase